MTELSAYDLTRGLLRRMARRLGEEIARLNEQFALLHLMMAHPCRIVGRTRILGKIWDISFDPDITVVETRVSNLRQRVDTPFDTALIEISCGMGDTIRVPRWTALGQPVRAAAWARETFCAVSLLAKPGLVRVVQLPLLADFRTRTERSAPSEISDDGVGRALEVAARAMQGTGLGRALVQAVAERYGATSVHHLAHVLVCLASGATGSTPGSYGVCRLTEGDRARHALAGVATGGSPAIRAKRRSAMGRT